ncbi:hypothetical protein I4U23_019593 [Adineta vaga]|nr:hypothetical protein I4U23_019593 [Adineta vaga]
MTSRDLVQTKRFIHRSPNRKLIAYINPIDQSRSHVTAKLIQSEDSSTRRWSPSPPATPPSPLTDELQLPSKEQTRLLIREERPLPGRREPNVLLRREHRVPIKFEQYSTVKYEPQQMVREERQVPIRIDPQVSTREERRVPIRMDSQLPIREQLRSSSPERLVNANTPRAELGSTRRVVVVRSRNNRQGTQKSNRSGDEKRQDTVTVPISTSVGNKSIYFIRRPIVVAGEEEEEIIHQ